MRFAFTDDQEMIREAAAAFLDEVSPPEAVRQAMVSDLGHDPAVWQRLCEDMVWHAATVPEDCDGLGLGFVELAILLEQMGRTLLCGPYFATVGLAVNTLRLAASPAQQRRILGRLVETGNSMTVAWRGAVSADVSPARDPVTCTINDQTAVLSGQCPLVPDGDTADQILVAARLQGQPEQAVLCLVPGNADGLQRAWTPSLDQTRRLATLHFDNVAVSTDNLLSGADDVEAALEQSLDLARIALAAEQLGGITQCLDASVAYISERVQFGRPVGSFQALKHKAADMMVQAENARSAVYYAACVADQFLTGSASEPTLEPTLNATLAAELKTAASVAQAVCSDAYYFNAGCAIQLHGGVGITWEYDTHLYFKRAKATQHLLGDTPYHRERIATALLGPAS